MRLVRSLFAATALILGTSARSTAYQPPAVQPGDSWTYVFPVHNSSERPVIATARARLVGSRFWGSQRQTAVRGPWVSLPPQSLTPDEVRDVPAILTVPDEFPVVLEAELRPGDGGAWHRRNLRPLLYSGAPGPVTVTNTESGAIPFRMVSGGSVLRPEDEEGWKRVTTESIRDAEAWDAFRERMRFLPPESWGLPTDESTHVRRLEFAAPLPPDLSMETLLAIRTSDHDDNHHPRRLWVRSVVRRADGTIVCSYSYRYRVTRGPIYGLQTDGKLLLVAVPRTDAPIVFRRVP